MAFKVRKAVAVSIGLYVTEQLRRVLIIWITADIPCLQRTGGLFS